MWARIRSFLNALFFRARMEESMRAEFDSHRERYADDLIASGVGPEEARRLARIEFGSTEVVREECRESVGLRWPLEVSRDLRYAARVLRKSPAFTITAVLTLALCIGLNTAIFSVVDSLLLRSLPLPDSSRLFTADTTFREHGESDEDIGISGHMLEMLHSAKSFDAAGFAGLGLGANLVNGNQSEYVKAQRITSGFFHVLGVSPELGRELTPEEDRVGGSAVAVLSYTLWDRMFNHDPNAIGRSINVRGEPHTIVGIMPASFKPVIAADLWTPLRPTVTGEGEGPNYGMVARLRPGATWAQADTEMQVIGAAAYKGHINPGATVEVHAVPIQRLITFDVRSPLMVLWGAVIIVLLIGCVNIAGLLLVRGATRRRELGTRMALGSGRGGVIRQLLSETILLAAIGGSFGILLGRLGLNVLKLLAGHQLDLNNVSLDSRVLLISVAASLCTGLVFGIIPALQASRVDLRTALVEGGTRGSTSGSHWWTRRALVVAELALGVVLLVVAGLLIQTFSYIKNLNPGFDGRGTLAAGVSLQDARYDSLQSVNRLFDRTIAKLGQLPGVQYVAAAMTIPYERGLNTGVFRLDGPHVDKKARSINMIYVTPQYFDAIRARRLAGRAFADSDNAGSQPVAIVTEAFVRRFLSEQNPVGSHIKVENTAREIVGVVGNIQYSSGFESFSPGNGATVFIPAAQTSDKLLQVLHRWFTPSWVVRTSGRPEGLITEVQRAVREVDPQLPIASFRSMDQVVSGSLADERFQAVLLGSLAALALLLAAVGIYGLIANSVVERTRELGIRMALGASVWQAVRAVALPGVVLALIGITTGCVLARGSAGLVKHLLYGVRNTDPATFVVAALVLLLASVVACLIPALRVTRLNPADTLRVE